ncbi:hypothetical protein ACFL2Q_19010 [Thermodesulfobacteriota bacterium]
MSLCDPPPVDEGVEQVKQVTEMPLEELRQLPEHFDRVLARIGANGGSYICKTVLDNIYDKLAEASTPATDEAEWLRQGPGMTRNCHDPWII